jgi:hypothetical protein
VRFKIRDKGDLLEATAVVGDGCRGVALHDPSWQVFVMDPVNDPPTELMPLRVTGQKKQKGQ